MGRVRRTASMLASVVMIGLAGPLPSAARPLDAIKSEGTLRVGLTGDYAPYSLRGADGQIAGADVIMAQALAKPWA
jgi:cyclohexadienyl dehydratase